MKKYTGVSLFLLLLLGQIPLLADDSQGPVKAKGAPIPSAIPFSDQSQKPSDVNQTPASQPADRYPPATDDKRGDRANGIPEKFVDLYCTTTDPKNIVVVDQDGKYMPDVRQIDIRIIIGMQQPIVKLTSWKGIYKPTAGVTSDVYQVRKFWNVTPEALQGFVDQVGK